MKAIAVYLNDAEMADFEFVKCRLERRSNCDTVRAMLSFCKKNLDTNIRITNIREADSLTRESEEVQND